MSLGLTEKIKAEKTLRDTPETKVRKEKILKEIPLGELAAFELWAFRAQTPMVYDERVPFLWQCVHSTKPMPEDLDDMIKEMVRIWKSRFSGEEIFVMDDA